MDKKVREYEARMESKAKEDKKFSFSAIIVITGIFLTQPTQPVKFLIMLFLLCLSSFSKVKLNELQI